ncbi:MULTISPECIES: flagellar basal body L-ring protein FlgH [Thalassospira]|uniref:Flagellar L-ring protein n=2 Tax=Thalassospira TaxID=168934 RepID=A0A367W9C2_9PROT|nr:MULTISPECIES: flagellar basal body L-ring protein FlgH [Thalassospira]MDG4718298.1 flagellar basal body L-ring protein FlgH [Thalassospira sp. FZY0004]RCK38046.1 flagellar L-ring protein FlgH [Thalassospira profundimaris]
MPGKNTHMSWRRIALVTGLISATALLSGCNAMKRLSEVGEPPKLSSIDNPTQSENYRPVSLPMPAPQIAESNPNSLWRSGARSFFKDQRANQVGDILTVVVDMSDSAALANTTTRSRTNSEDLAVPNLFGLEAEFTKVLPETIDPSSMFDMNSATSNRGAGSLDRTEAINLRVAAIVIQVLPNGNYVIHGRQEIRVNSEVREVQIAGVIRAADISSANEVGYDKIAEARISYGGRGTISDVQQPRYGSEVLDIILPF